MKAVSEKAVPVSRCVLLARTLFWIAAMVLACGTRGQAAATLSDTFSGNAQFIADPFFQPSSTVTLDAETSTCFFNGKYMMYYRSFLYRNSGGGISTSSTPTGIALETSTDGNNFTPYNSGLPVIPNGSGGIGANGIYAPSVLVDNVGSPLKMVFEENPSSGTQRVAKAESTDGITWTNFAIIITPQYQWEGYSNGQIIGNVGTPSIEKFGSTYYVFYHGFTGVNQSGCLARGFASGPSLTSLTKCASNPVLRGTTGTWSDIGIGRGDVFQEGAYYYCVFEALKGSALCTASTGSGWGIAQSSAPV
ncbi:MAG: hypothetical protein LC772_06450 [Chloroflexi bacterium]|nr:hypothetical protein [Chloroflexota bacterium]